MFQIPLLLLLPGMAGADRPVKCALPSGSGNQSSPTICIDWKKVGRKFEGLGALSGGGGTSRLLYDYEDPYRSDILDALFAPKSGGAMHILKVEIGGDAQSTEATEASHMHTKDDENYNRGYEWWLMKEAKARNPAIKLSALSWGAPGWVGNGQFFSDDNLDYHIKWLQGAKKVHSLDIDYMGIWNEHDASSDWIVRLRQAMDAAGFSSVKIVATDEGGWPICDAMVKNETIRNAVDVVGSHYPIQGANLGVGRNFSQAGPLPASCQLLNTQYNKSMWTSEGWNLAYVNDWRGGLNLASTINRNYVIQNQTAMVVWNLIYSWYSLLTYATPNGAPGGMGHGLMSAVEPWSGNYRLEAPLYAMMHTTQATVPDQCHYLENSAFSGNTPGHSNGWLDPTNRSTIVAFQCGVLNSQGWIPRGWVTIVIETSGLKEPLENQILAFRNYPGGEYVVNFNMTRSCEGDLFNNIGQVPTFGPDKHDIYLNLTFNPGCIYTIVSNTPPAPKLSAIKPNHEIPKAAEFPTQWSDTFDNYTADSTVKYFTDEAGSFAAVKAPPHAAESAEPAGVGMVLGQQVCEHPINGRWWGNSEPYTLLGNSQNWTDMTVEVAAMIANASINATILPESGGLMPAPAFARVCGRISTFSNHGSPVAGYCLIVDGNRSWFLSNGGKAYGTRDQPYVLASGKLPPAAAATTSPATAEATPYIGTWHTLKLELVGTQVTGTVDGKIVWTGADTKATFTHGMVAIGSGWHLAYFDNFTVNAKTTN